MVRICLIGCGAMAKLHLSSLQAVKNTSVKIVDPLYESALRIRNHLPQGEDCKVRSATLATRLGTYCLSIHSINRYSTVLTL